MLTKHLMLAYILSNLLICSTVAFQLPDLSLDTSVSVDNHQEVVDSLVNSTVSSFEFNLNLSTVTLGISCFMLVLLVVVTRRQSILIANIGRKVFQQEVLLRKLLKQNAQQPVKKTNTKHTGFSNKNSESPAICQ